ncbi:MAG: hypothetical protein ABI655_01550 [Phenylobacterium sp.]
MSTLTELVAAVVVHSSAVAFSHFGVVFEPTQIERTPAVERVIARTPRPPEKVVDCPTRRGRPAQLLKA